MEGERAVYRDVLLNVYARTTMCPTSAFQHAGSKWQLKSMFACHAPARLSLVWR